MLKARLTVTLVAAVSAQAANAEDCLQGPYQGNFQIFTLVMDAPQVGAVETPQLDGPVSDDTVLARQIITMRPTSRYLEHDVEILDEDGKSLAQSVPLAAGSQITIWRSGSEIRECSIGWRNGLFGGATGEGHYRWICLEDRNRDGAYDLAWRPRTKNLGLSFSRLDIPLPKPVRAVSARPERMPAAVRNATALGENEFERKLVVRDVSRRSIKLRYEGLSRRQREDVDLPAVAGESVRIGGFTVTVRSVDGKDVLLTTSGTFSPANIVPQCDRTFFSVDGLTARATFTFPDW